LEIAQNVFLAIIMTRLQTLALLAKMLRQAVLLVTVLNAFHANYKSDTLSTLLTSLALHVHLKSPIVSTVSHKSTASFVNMDIYLHQQILRAQVVHLY
jgi:hypothetical protein